MTHVAGDSCVFHQDGALVMLRRETQTFIAPNLCPANIPDLNPVGLQDLWSLVGAHVPDIITRQRQTDTGSVFRLSVINDAVYPFRNHLTVCVKAEGGHFEQLL